MLRFKCLEFKWSNNAFQSTVLFVTFLSLIVWIAIMGKLEKESSDSDSRLNKPRYGPYIITTLLTFYLGNEAPVWMHTEEAEQWNCWSSPMLVVFNFGCLQFWSSLFFVLFIFGNLHTWLSSYLVVFLFGRLHIWSSSYLVVFLCCRLNFWSS